MCFICKCKFSDVFVKVKALPLLWELCECHVLNSTFFSLSFQIILCTCKHPLNLLGKCKVCLQITVLILSLCCALKQSIGQCSSGFIQWHRSNGAEKPQARTHSHMHTRVHAHTHTHFQCWFWGYDQTALDKLWQKGSFDPFVIPRHSFASHKSKLWQPCEWDNRHFTIAE